MALTVLPGLWQGEYIDAFGHRADLDLDIETDGPALRGRVRIRLVTDEEPQLISGTVEGKADGRGGSMEFHLDAVDESFKNRVHLSEASSFARQAMYGVATATGTSGMGGGVWIAWLYDRPLDRG